MGNIVKTKMNILYLIIRIVACVMLVAGILLFSIEFNDDFNHDLEIEVGIASPDDEFYTIQLEGEIDNHTTEIVSGTLNVKLKDSKGKVATATFENLTILGKSEVEIDKTNKSVTTNLFDAENGLDYDIKIVEVTVGNVEFLAYSSRPVIAIPLLIVGVGMLLVVQLLAVRKPKENVVEE